MGWYFRKSKSIGPVRLNFSKSGMSVSSGVKGARMTFVPRGTFVSVGGNGVYYRKKLGSSTKNTLSHDNSYARRASSCGTDNCSQTVDAIKVQARTDGPSVTNQAIVKDIKRVRLFNWLWAALSVLLMAYVGWWTFPIMPVLHILPTRFFRAEVDYEMDGESALEWEKFSEFFSALKTNKKLCAC